MECIGKGKAHRPYEFGVKVSVATPLNRCKGGQFVAHVKVNARCRSVCGRFEENGVVERRFYSMSPPRAEYVLTAKGRDLGPIVRAMRDWGRKYAR